MSRRRHPEYQHCRQALGRVTVAFLVAMTLLPAGCVRRRLAVRSDPPGAMVFVDNQQIGTTPCSVDFTYYGTREIRLVKPGYETLTVNQPIPTPWYEIPPIDFFSENLVPTKIQDHRTVSFDLAPQVIVPTEQLLDRANQLRQETLQGAVLPAAAIAIPNATVPVGAVPPPGTFGPQPTPLPPTTEIAPPQTFGPNTATPAPAPFAPPTLPAQPLDGTFAPQQGPPITSPPLR